LLKQFDHILGVTAVKVVDEHDETRAGRATQRRRGLAELALESVAEA
jgi:hypothetical protein